MRKAARPDDGRRRTAALRGGADDRVAWVDYAKGFCIVFVVMMHSTGRVEWHAGQEGWMHSLVAFAKPFRMPDFFMISGLFLARVLDRRWRDYLDRKVVHFAYFYVLWVLIGTALHGPETVAEQGWTAPLRHVALSLVQPEGTLWFIYMLPVFCVATKLLRRVPWPVVWLAAAGLEAAPVETGIVVLDSFAGRYVYFFSGYVFAPHLFRLAEWSMTHVPAALGLLLGWGLLNGVLVFSGWAETPGVSLGLGFLGAAAVIGISALLSRSGLMAPLRYCGQNSIVIYLSFFIPMTAARIALQESGLIADIGTVSLIVTAAAVVCPLIGSRLIRGTRLRYVFERPEWARITRRRAVPSVERSTFSFQADC